MTPNNSIIVSICYVTYNHENYIRQCLDGLVMQKTTFPFEIIVHNDASTDKTADIIGNVTSEISKAIHNDLSNRK